MRIAGRFTLDLALRERPVYGARFKAASLSPPPETEPVVSKNGNSLLKIGPRAGSSIPEGMRRRLLALGEWLQINGEAIFATRPWSAAADEPARGGNPRGAANIWFTAKPNVVYVILPDGPAEGSVRIRSLGQAAPPLPRPMRAVSMWGTKGILEWKRTPEWLEIVLPAKRPCEHAHAVKIELWMAHLNEEHLSWELLPSHISNHQ